MRVASFDIVFQEIPGEVTLALNLSNCPCHCPGCHSQHLWEDIGEPLDEELLDSLISRYKGLITCVCFMGGDADPAEVLRLAEYIHRPATTDQLPTTNDQRPTTNDQRPIKTAWYSGRPALPECLSANRSVSTMACPCDALSGIALPFDYVKLGPYIEELGGLKSPDTNQRLYKRVGDSWEDITSLFWRKTFE